MSYKHFVYIILFLYTSVASSQHVHTDKCGVTIQDQILNDLLHPNDFRGDHDRNTTIYIPVKFHLTANADGTGRIEIVHVLNQLCILNRDYAASNMVFYIYDGFNFINQTNIYTAAGSNANAVAQKKSPKALNIFITENADLDANTSGTTLGFYNPQGDYIIIRKKELIDKSNTLSHEVGHFFNLRHTFYGWEGVPYNKDLHGETVTFTTVPGGIAGIQVELMDGSNCTVAADQICDTPPDYNFGFTAGNCIFNKVVYDKNGDRVIPMKNNQMGYFSDCDTFKFTEGQILRKTTNYNSSTRSYIRSTFVPNIDEIQGQPILTSPINNTTVATFDNVTFDWEDVPGASKYLIEIRGQGQYIWAIVNNSSYNSIVLKKSNQYFWTVKPFNDGNACSVSTATNFKTGNGTVATEDELALTNKISVNPNPISQDGNIYVNMELYTKSLVTYTIYNTLGHQQYTKSINLPAGTSIESIDASLFAKGIYLLKTTINNQSSIQKIIIQ